jgi:hypothetical protein
MAESRKEDDESVDTVVTVESIYKRKSAADDFLRGMWNG